MTKEIKAEVKVQDIIDWFEDGEEVVKVEIDKDGWNAALQGEAYGYDDTVYKIELEKFDYEECGDIENYKFWLNVCYLESVEIDDYLIKIKFI